MSAGSITPSEALGFGMVQSMQNGMVISHAIATGNLLPATVKTVCVDINPAVVTKLSDRGTFQATGLVTDVEPFLRSLCNHLREEPGKIAAA